MSSPARKIISRGANYSPEKRKALRPLEGGYASPEKRSSLRPSGGYALSVPATQRSGGSTWKCSPRPGTSRSSSALKLRNSTVGIQH